MRRPRTTARFLSPWVAAFSCVIAVGVPSLYASAAPNPVGAPPTLTLLSSGPAVRPPGTPITVDVAVSDLALPAVGMQVFLEWDTSQLTFTGVSDGDSGFERLLGPTLLNVPGSPNLKRVALATGRIDAGPGVTSGVLARVSFTVAADALVCAPENLLRFGPTETVYSTKLTASGGVAIPFTGAETVSFGTDHVAPTLTGLPSSVTLSPGRTTSPELEAFVAAVVTAPDACGAATVTRLVTLPGGSSSAAYPSQFPVGVTTVTWSAADGSSNSSTEQRTVTVLPCPGPFVTYFRDADSDGFGRDSDSVSACDGAPTGYVVASGDCNDSSNATYPGAPELCATEGTDNDCDSDAYEATDKSTWYADTDSDGAGDPLVTQQACNAPAGFVAVAGDACPANAALTAPVSYFVDGDGDGYGSSSTASFCETSAPAGHSTQSGDCNDVAAQGGAATYPGAPEVCATEGVDNDCDSDAYEACLLYTSPSPRDLSTSRMPSSA